MKKIIIISDVGKKVGLGHLIRSEVLTKEINFYFKKKIKVKNLLFSQEKKNNIFFKSNLVKTVFDINKKLKEYNPKIIFLNNSSLFEKKFGSKLINFINFNLMDAKIISIDSYFDYLKYLDHLWVPNIEVKSSLKKNKKIHYGWEKLLIRKENSNLQRKLVNKLIISLGGTDYFKIIEKLPIALIKYLKISHKVNLLIGPFAKKPKKLNKLSIGVLKNKKNLNYLRQYNLGLVLFGVSFFELILYKIPCVVLVPKGKEKKFIIRKLKNYKIVVSSSLSEAIKKLNNIASDINYKKRIVNLSKKISFSNRKKFYEKILRLK